MFNWIFSSWWMPKGMKLPVLLNKFLYFWTCLLSWLIILSLHEESHTHTVRQNVSWLFPIFSDYKDYLHWFKSNTIKMTKKKEKQTLCLFHLFHFFSNFLTFSVFFVWMTRSGHIRWLSWLTAYTCIFMCNIKVKERRR